MINDGQQGSWSRFKGASACLAPFFHPSALKARTIHPHPVYAALSFPPSAAKIQQQINSIVTIKPMKKLGAWTCVHENRNTYSLCKI